MDDLVAAVQDEGPQVPRTRAQISDWCLELLSKHPHGLQAAAMAHMFFVEFNEPLSVPFPHVIRDEDDGWLERQQTRRAGAQVNQALMSLKLAAVCHAFA